MNLFEKILMGIKLIITEVIIFLPNDFSKFRVKLYNKKMCKINRNVSLATNVRISGKVIIQDYSSIAYNCCLNGMEEGIHIGKYVMIAPNVVIVAFNHNYSENNKPMVLQGNTMKKIIIEDNVWIGANTTILPGVSIGTGSIVGANSVVNKNILPNSLYAGNPAKFIKRINAN